MSATEPLARPMNAGELLDRAITLYRKNFLTLVGIVTIVNAPLLIVHVIGAVLTVPTNLASLSQRSSASSLNSSILIYFLIVLLVSIPVGIATIFQNGALAAVASEFFLGRTLGIKAAYGRALRHGLPLFGGVFLIVLVNIGIFGFLFIPYFGLLFGLAFGSNSSAASAALGIFTLCICAGFIPAIILALVLNTHWIFTSQAIILESRGARAGLGRSWRLVRGSFWRVLAISILMGLFVSTITATPTWVASFGALALTASPIIQNVVTNTIQIVINIFAAPIQYAILTLLYYDLRIRKEGFDLEMQAQQIAESQA